MVTVLISHRVADYDVWQREYDAIVASPLGSAVRSHTVWRGLDDPNLVILAETYDSRESAAGAFDNPLLPAAIAKAGVDVSTMRIDYVDEVAAGAH
jgi:hypothetical protein